MSLKIQFLTQKSLKIHVLVPLAQLTLPMEDNSHSIHMPAARFPFSSSGKQNCETLLVVSWQKCWPSSWGELPSSSKEFGNPPYHRTTLSALARSVCFALLSRQGDWAPDTLVLFLTVATKHMQNLILNISKEKTLEPFSSSVSGQRTVILEQLPRGQGSTFIRSVGSSGVCWMRCLYTAVYHFHTSSLSTGISLYIACRFHSAWNWKSLHSFQKDWNSHYLIIKHKHSVGLLTYITTKMCNPKLFPDSSLSANSPQLHKTKSGPTTKITKKHPG